MTSAPRPIINKCGHCRGTGWTDTGPCVHCHAVADASRDTQSNSCVHNTDAMGVRYCMTHGDQTWCCGSASREERR